MNRKKSEIDSRVNSTRWNSWSESLCSRSSLKRLQRNSQSVCNNAHKGRNEREWETLQSRRSREVHKRGRFWVTVRAVTRTKGRCWNALIASAPPPLSSPPPSLSHSLSLAHSLSLSIPTRICSGNTPFSPRETQEETLKPRENAISTLLSLGLSLFLHRYTGPPSSNDHALVSPTLHHPFRRLLSPCFSTPNLFAVSQNRARWRHCSYFDFWKSYATLHVTFFFYFFFFIFSFGKSWIWKFDWEVGNTVFEVPGDRSNLAQNVLVSRSICTKLYIKITFCAGTICHARREFFASKL